MKELGKLLKRYAHIQAPQSTLKKAFIKSVEDTIGITLTKKDIDITRTIVKLHTSSTIKNEIRFNQKEILERVVQEVGDKNALTSIF